MTSTSRDDAGLQPEHSLDELSAFESDYDESAAGEKPLIPQQRRPT